MSNHSVSASIPMSASVPLASAPGTITVGIASQQANLDMFNVFVQPKPTALIEQIISKLANIEKRIDALNEKLETKEKEEIVAKLEEIVKRVKK